MRMSQEQAIESSIDALYLAVTNDAHWPEALGRTSVLSVDQSDIADPIGGPLEYYETCATQIKAQLERRVAELDL